MSDLVFEFNKSEKSEFLSRCKCLRNCKIEIDGIVIETSFEDDYKKGIFGSNLCYKKNCKVLISYPKGQIRAEYLPKTINSDIVLSSLDDFMTYIGDVYEKPKE